MDFSRYKPHKLSEEIISILKEKTNSSTDEFFRILVVYYFAKMASMMRVNIDTHDRGSIPVNVYALNLMSSGQGKGHSTNILEEQIINQFQKKYMGQTFKDIAEINLNKLAMERSVAKGTDPDKEMEEVQKEFNELGNMLFGFNSATTAAIKQMRHKLLMANSGSINLEIDEIGSNLLNNADVLGAFLEIYDVGKIKQKLTKNTKESTRNEEMDGRTPANLMMFGAPVKVLDGAKVEDALFTFFDTGYARRCIFGFPEHDITPGAETPEELYALATNTTTRSSVDRISQLFGNLANQINYNISIEVSKTISLEIIKYKSYCEKLAFELPTQFEMRRAELQHRYFKALKIAGAYAFVDTSQFIEQEHWEAAVKLVEESGDAFTRLVRREKPYVKLAKYIASINRPLTQADLVEDLPYYRGSEGQKRELINLAIAYGNSNNIVIKKQFLGGVELLSGEELQAIDLDNCVVSYSTQLAENYVNEFVKFKELGKLIEQPNYHWVNHHLNDNYRLENNCMPGFNMMVLDVDGGATLNTVQQLLKDYTYLLHTTKSHSNAAHRFRVIMPISHLVKLSAEDYKEFTQNLYSWLPVALDTSTDQRSKKWMTHKVQSVYNKGTKLLDALMFIPRTKKAEEYKELVMTQTNLDNMERWFINNTGDGNRSNQLYNYARMLLDSGANLVEVQTKVLGLNSKLSDSLEEAEILTTIIASASRAVSGKT